MKAVSPNGALRQLTRFLGVELQLVEHLLFKLVVARLMMASDETRFLPRVLAEIELVEERLREAEARRTLAIEELAKAWKVDPSQLTLARLVEMTEEPYRSALADHREAFLDLADQVEQVVRENRRLATTSLKAVTEGIARLTGYDGPPVYTRRGLVRSTQRAGRLDEVL